MTLRIGICVSRSLQQHGDKYEDDDAGDDKPLVGLDRPVWILRMSDPELRHVTRHAVDDSVDDDPVKPVHALGELRDSRGPCASTNTSR